MGLEPPVLEYARVERVGGGDRYRLGFLLAGVPALVGMCVPIGYFPPWVLDVMLPALRRIHNGGFSSRSLWGIAIVTASLAPLSAMGWRGVRLGGGKPGRILGIIGLTFGGIHVVGTVGLVARIVRPDSGGIGRVATAAVVGVVLVVCGGFFWRSRARLDLAICVLLVLVSVEMAFWLVIGLLMLQGLGTTGWGLVFLTTAVVRGLEFAHVLRSRRLVGQRV